MQYDLSQESDSTTDFLLRCSDIDIWIDPIGDLKERPLQDRVDFDFLDECGIIGKMGTGWTPDLCVTWFDKTKKKETKKSVDIGNQSQDTRSVSIYQPSSTGRNVTTAFELQESNHILSLCPPFI